MQHGVGLFGNSTITAMVLYIGKHKFKKNYAMHCQTIAYPFFYANTLLTFSNLAHLMTKMKLRSNVNQSNLYV